MMSCPRLQIAVRIIKHQFAAAITRKHSEEEGNVLFYKIEQILFSKFGNISIQNWA